MIDRREIGSDLLSTVPEVCIERAKLITEAYMQMESMPIVLKRAKGLEKILEEMSIYIQDLI